MNIATPQVICSEGISNYVFKTNPELLIQILLDWTIIIFQLLIQCFPERHFLPLMGLQKSRKKLPQQKHHNPGVLSICLNIQHELMQATNFSNGK